MKSGKILAVLCAAAIAGCASQAPAPSAAATKPVASKPARKADQIMMDELMDNPSANAIFKKHAPVVADHPQLTMARGMTLADVAGYAEAGLSQQTVQAIVDEVNKLP